MNDLDFFTLMDFEIAFYNETQHPITSSVISYQELNSRNSTSWISNGSRNYSISDYELNIPYTIFETLVGIFAVIGNLMVIFVFQRERKLRRRTNYYIVSLAMADFLVGSLGVPFAVLASIGLPTNLYACLFTVSLLVVLCTISIFCLVAVSVDRYWAILYPMAYSRNVRTRTAIVIISLCWLAGTLVGFLPLFGWHAAEDDGRHACLFVEVMDYNYLVFLYFTTIITPALLMLAFYAHIYRVIIKQVRQMVTMHPTKNCQRSVGMKVRNQQQTSTGRSTHGGTMLRVLGAARKRDIKAAQNLSVIVLFFMICWIPLYTINCIEAFCSSCKIHPKLTLFCIILSHLNSAVNPLLYAYHLKDFRLALKNLILRVLGMEVEQPLETIHRYSMASQHRLQSYDVSGRHTQTKIYIDSPIWLKQQQAEFLKERSLKSKCGVITPCLNNVHKTMAAVAALATNTSKNLWNFEDSSNANITEAALPNISPRTTLPTTAKDRPTKVHNYFKSFSYDNCTFNTDMEDPQFKEISTDDKVESFKTAVDAENLNYNRPAHSYSDYEIIHNQYEYQTGITTPYYSAPLTLRELQTFRRKYELTDDKLVYKPCISYRSSLFIADLNSEKVQCTSLITAFKDSFKDDLVTTTAQDNLTNRTVISNNNSLALNYIKFGRISLSTTALTKRKINKFQYYTIHHLPSLSRQLLQQNFTSQRAKNHLILPNLLRHSSSMLQLIPNDRRLILNTFNDLEITSLSKDRESTPANDSSSTFNTIITEAIQTKSSRIENTVTDR